ncbi:MAG: ABC transporter permease [Kiritimatiellae bacterium]|nr:ABC transporter permease [Kiritimatiellia bacterium]
MNQDEPGFEYVIEPSGGWFRLNLRELARYRDLLVLLVKRDFVARYKQTILGPLWFVLQPLMHTVMFTIVLGRIAGLSPEGQPKLLFYFSGMLAWQYFAMCMQGTSTTFLANAGLFGKVYFPRIVVPVSVVISSLLAFALQLAFFLCFFLYYKFGSWAGPAIRPGWQLVLLPLVVLHTAALALGVGLWMSALTAKYRDFMHLAGFLTELWKYATFPLLMSLAKIKENLAGLEWLLAVNPMSPIVMWYRRAFLGLEGPSPALLAVSGGITVLILLSGIVVFSRVEKTFIDTV